MQGSRKKDVEARTQKSTIKYYNLPIAEDRYSDKPSKKKGQWKSDG